MLPLGATCSPDLRGSGQLSWKRLQRSREKAKGSGPRPRASWSGRGLEGRKVRLGAQLAGTFFLRGRGRSGGQGAWFSSAAVTMTSIQIRMASGLGATI